MKGIYFDGAAAAFRTDLPVPEPGENCSLIRVKYANVCSTDREILKGYRPDFKGVMGHEFAGTVVKSGKPELLGKLVVGELNHGCGHCWYCTHGLEKHCQSRTAIGIDGADGCFAEYLVLPDHLIHVVPEGLAPEQAVFAEPLAAALEIMEQVHIGPDSRVALTGDGRLALFCGQVLSLTGCSLTVFGKHEEKLALFDSFADIKLITQVPQGRVNPDDQFDVVVDCTGHPSGLELSGRLVRHRGTIVLKSTFAGKAYVDMSYFVVNEITITGSRCGPFEPALRLLQKGLVHLPPIEVHKMEDFQKAFESSAFKAGFAPETE